VTIDSDGSKSDRSSEIFCSLYCKYGLKNNVRLENWNANMKLIRLPTLLSCFKGYRIGIIGRNKSDVVF